MNKLSHRNFSFKVFGEVQSLCAPLVANFNCNFFIYQRNFIDEERMKIKSSAFLCSDPAALEFILNLRKTKRESAKYDYDSKERQYVLLETTQPKFANMLRTQFNFNNILCRDEKVGIGEWEHLIIATSLCTSGVINNYINNIAFFDKFIMFFRDAARKLIKGACDDKFIADRIVEKCNFQHVCGLKNPLQITLPKHFSLVDAFGQLIDVPSSELRCLILFCKGRTTKEIASALNLSPRTVESHVQNSKTRLNCYNRSSLFDVLQKNKLILLG